VCHCLCSTYLWGSYRTAAAQCRCSCAFWVRPVRHVGWYEFWDVTACHDLEREGVWCCCINTVNALVAYKCSNCAVLAWLRALECKHAEAHLLKFKSSTDCIESITAFRICRPDCPTMLDYKTHAENESMYNTPPCYAIYICGLVFDYLLKKGE